MEVKERILEDHVLGFFSQHDYPGIHPNDNVGKIKFQMFNMLNNSPPNISEYDIALELVEGGWFLRYYEEIEDFVNSLQIPYSDVYGIYQELVASTLMRIYHR